MITTRDLNQTLDGLASRMEKVRDQRGLGMRAACQEVNLGVGRYSEIEAGATNITVGTLFRILTWLEKHNA